MPRNIGGELHSLLLSLYPELNRAYPLHAILNLLVVEERLFLLNFGSVPHQVLIYIFGGPRHEYFSLVVVFGEEIGQGPAVVEVGMGDDNHLYFLGVYFVKEGQTVRILLVDHQPAV